MGVSKSHQMHVDSMFFLLIIVSKSHITLWTLISTSARSSWRRNHKKVTDSYFMGSFIFQRPWTERLASCNLQVSWCYSYTCTINQGKAYVIWLSCSLLILHDIICWQCQEPNNLLFTQKNRTFKPNNISWDFSLFHRNHNVGQERHSSNLSWGSFYFPCWRKLCIIFSSPICISSELFLSNNVLPM